MRIILAPEGSRGDVQPLLALGKALLDRGCDVAMCASPDARELVEGRGVELLPMPVDARAFMQAHAADVISGVVRFQRAASRYFDEALRLQLPALVDYTRDADLIVGGGVQFGGPSVAELHGIPYRFVAYCPTVLESGEHPPFMIERPIRRRWLNRVAWRIFLFAYTLVMRGPLNQSRAALGLPPVRNLYEYLVATGVTLASDPVLAPCPADLRIPVEQVGFLFPPETEELPAKLAAFLDAGPPPVYIGFGSMPDPDPAATTRKLLGAVAAANLRAVISEGWARLGDVPLPEGVIAIGPVSHGKLFPRVRAVVHHGGAGTTHTAARAGVPQIVIPHLLDQYYFGDRVRRLGLGPPPLPRRKLEAESLASLLAETVDNEILSERADEFGVGLRRRDVVQRAADAVLKGCRVR